MAETYRGSPDYRTGSATYHRDPAAQCLSLSQSLRCLNQLSERMHCAIRPIQTAAWR